jgi:hypothetical protein
MERTKPKGGAATVVGAAVEVVAVTAVTTVAGWWILSTAVCTSARFDTPLRLVGSPPVAHTDFWGPPCKPRARPVLSLPL